MLMNGLVGCLILLFVGNMTAQDLSIDEIVMNTFKAEKYLGDDRVTMVNMDIKNSDQDVVMEREFLLIKKNVGNGLKQKWYTYFKKPADIRKLVFMVWKNPEEDDDRWLFLPAMDLVKRLAGSDKRSYFVGSQFVYEDVTGRSQYLDNHELVKTTDKFYEIKSTPKSTSGEDFQYYYTYVDKTTFIPMERTYYDNNGDSHRVFKTTKVETIQDFPTIVEFSMTNTQTGESTDVVFSGLKYNVGVDDKLFTEAQIRKTPRKWLKYFKN